MGNCFSGQRETQSSKSSSNKGGAAASNTATTATTTEKPEVKTNEPSTSSVKQQENSVATTPSTTTTTSTEPQKTQISSEEPNSSDENNNSAKTLEAKPTSSSSTNTVETTTTSSNFDSITNSFLLKPASLARYLIGPKGSTIKQLQEETSCKINIQDLDSDTKQVSIENCTTLSPEKVYQRLMAELKKYGWEYDGKEKQFIEHETEAMKLFKELEKKISEESKLMSDCFERASKAHESGDGALAKQLSDEGKKHQELMKKYQLESAQTMFEHLNKDKGDFEIDLHGQYVDNAMEFLRKRIEKLRTEKSSNKLTIIYGAGNHSDEKGPKIKPAVLEYLKEEGITFEEINHGSISANI
ncbi:hypothetical protein C9374_014138 [Naegleria lovaniensis]|uniref:Smr domain-containing protein n=1 Tax=Naegleria lovaniensis TaxID=51637 RepID=A0AA88H235_NAELO|nr:uncharacterized protein C9374_014138 [Naegleria lovaniensis]KAG2389578.1 hypothetical protein C9374_014138 [Naegleria lovaniensis]